MDFFSFNLLIDLFVIVLKIKQILLQWLGYSRVSVKRHYHDTRISLAINNGGKGAPVDENSRKAITLVAWHGERVYKTKICAG